MNLHVVPTWWGEWVVIEEGPQLTRFERLWKWYWPCVGRFVQYWPGMWVEK